MKCQRSVQYDFYPSSQRIRTRIKDLLIKLCEENLQQWELGTIAMKCHGIDNRLHENYRSVRMKGFKYLVIDDLFDIFRFQIIPVKGLDFQRLTEFEPIPHCRYQSYADDICRLYIIFKIIESGKSTDFAYLSKVLDSISQRRKHGSQDYRITELQDYRITGLQDQAPNSVSVLPRNTYQTKKTLENLTSLDSKSVKGRHRKDIGNAELTIHLPEQEILTTPKRSCHKNPFDVIAIREIAFGPNLSHEPKSLSLDKVQLSKSAKETASLRLKRRRSHDRKLSPFIVSLPYPSDDLANFEYVGCELGNILRDMEDYLPRNWNVSNLYENVERFFIIHDSRKAVEAFCLDYFNAEANIEECKWDGISKYVSAFPEDATICLCVFDRILETVHSETMENIMKNTIRHFDMKDVILIVCRPNPEFLNVKARIQVIADHVPSLCITSFHDQSGKKNVISLLYERRRRLIDFCIRKIEMNRKYEKIKMNEAIRDLRELKEICRHGNKEEFSYNIQNISQELQSLASKSIIACALDGYQLIIYVDEDLDFCKIQQIKQNFPYLTVEIRRRTIKDRCILVPHYHPGESIFSTDHQPLGTLGMFGQLDNETFVVITSPHVIAKSQTALIQNGGNLIDLGRCIWSPRRGLEESVPSIDDIAVIKILPNVRNTMEYRNAVSNVEIFERDSSALNRKRVFKYGAKTNYTEGHVQKSQLNWYSEEVAKSVCFIIIREIRRDRKFSEPGDSGAIVFTKDGTKYVAIGMIYGGITLPEFQNMSAAIRLDDAVDKFKESTHQHLFLSRF